VGDGADRRRRALFLRHHAEDDPGFVGAALKRRGYVVEVEDVDDATSHVALDGVGVLAVLGSKWSVNDRDQIGAWFDTELAAIREADDRGMAVLGICFGAQALCVPMGGGVGRAPRPELGWIELDANDDDGVPEGPWFQFHEDRCLPPARATVLVRNEVCVQAFRVGRHLGVQFHPELDAKQLARWYDAGADSQAVAHGIEPSALMKATETLEASAGRRVDRLVAGFLERAG